MKVSPVDSNLIRKIMAEVEDSLLNIRRVLSLLTQGFCLEFVFLLGST